MSTSEEQKGRYVLSYLRDDTDEDRRLNLQHEAIQHAILEGQLLHPSIPHSQVTTAIADLGCGTGIWLQDVSTTLFGGSEEGVPKLVGFDVNAHAFNSSPAPGVQLNQHDCTKPFDIAFIGTFDLVHIRGLAYALSEREFSLLLENAVQLLRPGGFLQWTETESTLFKALPETEKISKILGIINIERQQRELAQNLPHLMLREVLSLMSRLEGGPPERKGGSLMILNFNLRPGGVCRPGRLGEANLNDRLSEIILESMKLFLNSCLVRRRSLLDQCSEEELVELQNLMDCVDKVRASKEIKMGGLFPQLVLQKAV